MRRALSSGDWGGVPRNQSAKLEKLGMGLGSWL
jgi:hypothetical protein